ncbi:MAG: DUF262 domain-containing protein [Acidobacteria bacterium]|nr:DUF262 domain-containing protein [Acidobacteriota bacterium]
MGEPLRYEYGDKTILELQNLQEKGHLNLEPGFQRKSVWSLSDRWKLIQSVVEGYPIPSIFLYRRDENGMPVYDVIDGKQRLETLFMFTRTRGFMRAGFDVPFRFGDDDRPSRHSWKGLVRQKRHGPVLTYKIQTVEVSGDLSDIVDLFVRINSTGKALTSSEKRHAKYFKSAFLRSADVLTRRFRAYFRKQQIVTKTQIIRMKDVELVSEILASISAGGPIHKKAAIDRAVGNQSVNAHTLRRAMTEFRSVAHSLRRMFPELHTTRFRNRAEFYSLFMLLWELDQQHLVLTDGRRNQAASRLLARLSSGVDEVREMQKRAKGAKPEHRLYADYLLSVQQSTDNLAQRKRRAEILRGVLGGLFERKDDRRLFSPEQRRLLWNSDEKKCCRYCGATLDWTNFQVDHIRAHSRGGKTELKNAALTCVRCNTSKGAHRRIMSTN